MIKFIITAIALLGVAIPIIATDFWLLWLPIDHSEQYPSKMAALFMAVTAWVTLWVVLAAFRTIKQRDDQEERDRKDRLLNKIIEWAVDVKGCNLGKQVTVIAQLSDEQERNFFIAFASEMIGSFKIVETKGQLIINIAENLSEQCLKQAVQKVLKCLEEHIIFCEGYFKLLAENKMAIVMSTQEKATQEEVRQHKEQLDGLADKVIDEATKLMPK